MYNSEEFPKGACYPYLYIQAEELSVYIFQIEIPFKH